MKVARNEKLLKPTARSSGRNVQAGQNQTTHRRHRRADRTKSQQCTGGTGVREGLQPQRTGKTEPNCAQAAQESGQNKIPTMQRRNRSTGRTAAATYRQNRTQLRAGGTGLQLQEYGLICIRNVHAKQNQIAHRRHATGLRPQSTHTCSKTCNRVGDDPTARRTRPPRRQVPRLS